MTFVAAIGMAVLGVTTVGVAATRLICLLIARFTRRDLRTDQLDAAEHFPHVTFVLPIHSEPPSVVCDTLTAVSQLRYPCFDVLVIDNNTVETELWKPVEQYCYSLGSHFRFIHIMNVHGFKAGALKCASRFLSEQTELLAILDADTILAPEFLASIVPYFRDPQVGLVQSPPSYRDPPSRGIWRLIYAEYMLFLCTYARASFVFRATPFLGSAGVIRLKALEEVGGWHTWSLTEDMELGWRLVRAGWRCEYHDHTLGRGLLPYRYSDYLRQRSRWAHGNVLVFARYAIEFIGLRATKAGIGARLTYATAVGVWLYIGYPISCIMALAAFILNDTVLALTVPFGLASMYLSDCFQILAARSALSLRYIEVLGTLIVRVSLWPTMAVAGFLAIFRTDLKFIPTPKAADRNKHGTARKWLLLTITSISFSATILLASQSRGILAGVLVLLLGLPIVLQVLVASLSPRREDKANTSPPLIPSFVSHSDTRTEVAKGTTIT